MATDADYLDGVVPCDACGERWCTKCADHWAICGCPGTHDGDVIDCVADKGIPDIELMAGEVVGVSP